MKLRSNPARLHDSDKRQAASASWRNGKSTAAARGYNYQWQVERADYLRRFPLCAMCAKRGQVAAATVVDHIRPHGGDAVLFWDQSNWQPLCKPCHSAHKQRQERHAAAGRVTLAHGRAPGRR